MDQCHSDARIEPDTTGSCHQDAGSPACAFTGHSQQLDPVEVEACMEQLAAAHRKKWDLKSLLAQAQKPHVIAAAAMFTQQLCPEIMDEVRATLLWLPDNVAMLAVALSICRRGPGGRQTGPDPLCDPDVDASRARRILSNRRSAALSKIRKRVAQLADIVKRRQPEAKAAVADGPHTAAAAAAAAATAAPTSSHVGAAPAAAAATGGGTRPAAAAAAAARRAPVKSASASSLLAPRLGRVIKAAGRAPTLHLWDTAGGSGAAAAAAAVVTEPSAGRPLSPSLGSNCPEAGSGSGGGPAAAAAAAEVSSVCGSQLPWAPWAPAGPALRRAGSAPAAAGAAEHHHAPGRDSWSSSADSSAFAGPSSALAGAAFRPPAAAAAAHAPAVAAGALPCDTAGGAPAALRLQLSAQCLELRRQQQVLAAQLASLGAPDLVGPHGPPEVLLLQSDAASGCDSLAYAGGHGSQGPAAGAAAAGAAASFGDGRSWVAAVPPLCSSSRTPWMLDEVLGPQQQQHQQALLLHQQPGDGHEGHDLVMSESCWATTTECCLMPPCLGPQAAAADGLPMGSACAQGLLGGAVVPLAATAAASTLAPLTAKGGGRGGGGLPPQPVNWWDDHVVELVLQAN